MIKRTIYFGNPAYLSLNLGQLQVKLPEVEQNKTLSSSFKQSSQLRIAIEDIGVLVLDHSRITITQALMAFLLEHNVAVITCDKRHMPLGLFLNLEGHSLQSKRFACQIESTLPFKKQLWQQTVKQKIRNQAVVLAKNTKVETNMLIELSKQVRTGDIENMEGRAAAYYWRYLFDEEKQFKRERSGMHPNTWLDYGYAILRACVARALVASGLLPTLGIHHRNQYNAYCLADDIMEPYRPYVDEVIVGLIKQHPSSEGELTTQIKSVLLQIPVLDVVIEGKKSPLMIAVQLTTASLAQCFEGKLNKIKYPKME